MEAIGEGSERCTILFGVPCRFWKGTARRTRWHSIFIRKEAATDVPVISEVYPAGHYMDTLEIGDTESSLGANSTEFL